jgi:hypothetical protein
MSLYLIYLRRHGLDPDQDVAVLKEGFSWPAFFFTIIWAFWCRLWMATIIFILAQVALYLFFNIIQLNQLSQGIVFIGLAVMFGYLANEIHQLKLSKEGFELFAIVKGKNKDQALDQFLRNFPIIASELNR